ncbi:hypothetical protein [Peribacillus frigoritolerans]|uniref:hypothetical protein n=1 Tax=Peribacillus frigoritolerans TaxID=450367 RepID=UPI00158325B0|nr:hypothetical protein [Peribacillus frigoritolerans]
MISTTGTRFPRAGGSLLGVACGVSLGHAFPAGVSYLPFQSTEMFFKIKTAGRYLFGTKFKTSLSFKFFSPVILIGWKKIATLLPNYWLAETPQALAPRRLGRQSAEKEWISEIDWTF